jgi:serine/threonine-protein kinase RsbW
VGIVRHRLHRLLVDLPHVQLDDVLLAASEVLTNAVLHGDGLVAMRVSMQGPVLRVEVSDDGDSVPAYDVDCAEDAESGRGLFIVNVLAHRWGVAPNDPAPGKTVWFEMGRPLLPAVPRPSLRTDRWPHNTAGATPTHCYLIMWDRMRDIPGW